LFRCGVIQEGDRILAINDMSLENKTLEEANTLLKESGIKVLLQVEFDVAG
jgi:C-terminal processing protease CtpA/Prc